MTRTRIIFCCVLVMLAAGCKAQTTNLDSDLNRRIEIQIRSQFPVPPGYTVLIGPRAKSDFPGYDTVAITFEHGPKKSTVDFLLSTDGKTLARLEKFDISKNPSEIVSSANRPTRGNPSAKVVLVNFDDLECPYCAQMHSELFPTTLDHYKGLVRVVYKDYPLVEIHPWAMHAAINSNCLAEESGEAYWKYVDYLHANGAEVNGAQHDAAAAKVTLDRLAREEGQRSKVDMTRLNACLSKQDEAPIRASMKEGEALGVDGTPLLFVNGERLNGAVPTDVVWAAIDRALLGSGIQPPSASVPSIQGKGSPGTQ